MGLSVFGAGTVHADDSPEAETPLERVNALVQPSIVYLQQDWAAYIYDKANKQYLNGGQQFALSFQCTGFVVNPDGYIATAGHCVDLEQVKPVFFETAAQWAVDNGYYLDGTLTVEQIVAFQDYRVETMTKVNRADLLIQVGWGAAASGIETAEVRRARVVGSQKTDAGDVALLKVEATDLNALALSDEEVEVGTEVVSVGYPVSVDTVTDPDLTPSFKDGSISSVKTVQGGLLTVYEISAAVSGGMSGGPTVDLDGKVVGVNSFGITGETQPFNFVRPSAQLSELLASTGVENVLSETTQAYQAGLAAYWDGDKATAVEQLELVTQEQPSNQLAAEYLDKARDLPDPPPPAEEASGDGLPVLPIVLGVGGLLVLAAGAGFLLVRRSRKRAAPVPLPPADTWVVPALTPTAPAPPPPARTLTPAGPAGPAGGPAPVPLAPPAPGAQEGRTPVDDTTPKFCGNCGFHSHPGERFCEECGQPLVH
jgi:S1-C subfamily serine protease